MDRSDENFHSLVKLWATAHGATFAIAGTLVANGRPLDPQANLGFVAAVCTLLAVVSGLCAVGILNNWHAYMQAVDLGRKGGDPADFFRAFAGSNRDGVVALPKSPAGVERPRWGSRAWLRARLGGYLWGCALTTASALGWALAAGAFLLARAWPALASWALPLGTLLAVVAFALGVGLGREWWVGSFESLDDAAGGGRGSDKGSVPPGGGADPSVVVPVKDAGPGEGRPVARDPPPP